MHEHSFIQAIIKNVKNPQAVVSVELEVGELAGIEPEHLAEHLREETSWKVNVISKNSLVKCDCGYTGRARILQRLHDMVIFDCPDCSEIPEVLEGKNIKILNVRY